MDNQPNSNLPNKESWSKQISPNTPDSPVLGFLQLCADRRFHSAIQRQFQADTRLQSPEDYWIHADAGGTPKMECLRTAPDYCYYDKKVQVMGWSAHGKVCGGFGPNVPDEVIKQALIVVSQRRRDDYPNASHYVYFATTVGEGDAEETVVHCLKYEHDGE